MPEETKSTLSDVAGVEKEKIGLDAGSPPKSEHCEPPAKSPCVEPTEDDIRQMAYWLWTERVAMGMESDEKADWRQAEAFLKEEYQACLAAQGEPPVSDS